MDEHSSLFGLVVSDITLTNGVNIMNLLEDPNKLECLALASLFSMVLIIPREAEPFRGEHLFGIGCFT
jgi:hypothetical protein